MTSTWTTFLRSGSAPLCLVFAAGLVACDGCSLPIDSSSPPSVDDLDGDWTIASYSADDTGCEPEPTDAPYARIVASVSEDDGDQPGLDVRICPTADNCPEVTPPENQLNWNAEHHRGELTFYTADLVDGDPREQLCRLSMIQTLMIPEDTGAQLTRSRYEVTLPIEGEEACTRELADEYSAQMPCIRSKAVELIRPGGEGDGLGP